MIKFTTKTTEIFYYWLLHEITFDDLVKYFKDHPDTSNTTILNDFIMDRKHKYENILTHSRDIQDDMHQLLLELMDLALDNYNSVELVNAILNDILKEIGTNMTAKKELQSSDFSNYYTYLVYHYLVETEEWYDELVSIYTNTDYRYTSKEDIVKAFINELLENFHNSQIDLAACKPDNTMLMLHLLDLTKGEINYKEIADVLFEDIVLDENN